MTWGGQALASKARSFICNTGFKQLDSKHLQIWKNQYWPQDWKRSAFIPIRKKHNAIECSNYHMIVLILHARNVLFKILQAKLQQYMNQDLLAV